MSHIFIQISKPTALAKAERFDRSCERGLARTLVRRIVHL